MRIGIITGLGHLRPARARGGRSRPRGDAVRRGARLRGALRAGRRPARRAPRRGAPAPEQRGHPPGQHLGAARARRAGDPGRHGVRVARPRARARHADRLRRPALPGQPPARRLAVHAAHRARARRGAGTGSSTGPFSEPLRRALLDGAREAGCARARRRLLRPRRRPALQHADRDPDAHAAPASPPSRRPPGPRRSSPARPSCPTRCSATRPTTPTASSPRRRRPSRSSSASSRPAPATFARTLAAAVPRVTAAPEPVGTHFSWD